MSMLVLMALYCYSQYSCCILYTVYICDLYISLRLFFLRFEHLHALTLTEQID